MNKPKLGTPPAKVRQRDAVHVAIIACRADGHLKGGDPVKFRNGWVRYSVIGGDAIGVVDPFVDGHVKSGDLVWVILKPGITSDPVHYWTCAEIDDEEEEVDDHNDEAAEEIETEQEEEDPCGQCNS